MNQEENNTGGFGNNQQDNWIFPVRLSELEKKSFNNVFMITGRATLDPAGEAFIPISNVSLNNIALATSTDGTDVAAAVIIATSILFPNTIQLYINGTGTRTYNYIIFLTSNVDQ